MDSFVASIVALKLFMIDLSKKQCFPLFRYGEAWKQIKSLVQTADNLSSHCVCFSYPICVDDVISQGVSTA